MSDRAPPAPPAPESPAPAGSEARLLLEVDNVTLRFGGVVALDEVSFTLYEGEILGLIGPNGAGKTTCFNAMTGVYRPTDGRDPVRRAADQRQASSTRSPSSASPARSRTSGCSPR